MTREEKLAKERERNRKRRGTDAYKESQRKYRASEKGKTCQTKYRQSEKGKSFLQEYNKTDKRKEWLKGHRAGEKRKAYMSHYVRERCETDVEFKLRLRFSTAIYLSLRAKKSRASWQKIVGYTVSDLRKHLEARFVEGMSWNNYGDWHIDHVTPKSLFHYNSYEDDSFKQCWSLNNLQPLWAKENLAKGNRTVA